MILNATDREFVEMLCGKVRCASERHHEQLSALRGTKNPKEARRRRYHLVSSGLVAHAIVPARPSIRIHGPLACVAPGDPPPDFDALGYAAEKRFRDHPLQETHIYFATTKAVRTFGGSASGEMPNPMHVAHDICVTSILMHFLADEPDAAALWRGEDEMKHLHEKFRKVPDAFLCDEAGTPHVAIEFLGLYPPGRIEAFHRDMVNRGLLYELF
jgi:hypothetical protein